MATRKARIFWNGRSQAVRLPREFRFEGDRVAIRKSGESVILTPVKRSWDSLIASLDKFSPDYMGRREQGPQQRRRPFFD
jgi:antitoxin VapB